MTDTSKDIRQQLLKDYLIESIITGDYPGVRDFVARMPQMPIGVLSFIKNEAEINISERQSTMQAKIFGAHP